MAGNKNSGHRLDKGRMLLSSKSREYTEESLSKLVYLMRQDPDSRVQFAAAKEILDRGWGKPAQTIVQDVVVENVETPFNDRTRDAQIDLAKRIAFVLDNAVRQKQVEEEIIH